MWESSPSSRSPSPSSLRYTSTITLKDLSIKPSTQFPDQNEARGRKEGDLESLVDFARGVAATSEYLCSWYFRVTPEKKITWGSREGEDVGMGGMTGERIVEDAGREIMEYCREHQERIIEGAWRITDGVSEALWGTPNAEERNKKRTRGAKKDE
jgi:hypothetical protein